ncbi:MAG: tagaturonate reductase [Lewinellaceae bacterium]|nr:tagaturonate reductase [Saprospiraceae bacterium]MCB9344990.1 tagaturonate reductase [Lewinellaceae bacterium]
MDHLSKAFLQDRPELADFSLPEKVLQFGTGALLRALPDYLINKANRQGVFNGRVVVVKSTDSGSATAFDKQDGLYTICLRGIENGEQIDENIISSAISRVLSAKKQWKEILELAESPDLEIVISNTTEVGIQLVSEDIKETPPESFPGKLLSFLYTRYRHFEGDRSKGLVIVPTELLPKNGSLLESIILELAHLNNLEYGFIEWLEESCTFCNSLVDRIVPGQPAPELVKSLQETLGYQDSLFTVSEPYCLWAIEGDEQVAKILSFQQANPESVIVAPNIDTYRERKLRLLNGTHTLSCGLAILAGFQTVSEAMEDEAMSGYIKNLMFQEIIPAIPVDIPTKDAEQFAHQVLDRFRNPFVEHFWTSITVQYSTKMKMRNVPLVLEHYRKGKLAPMYFALGFAAFLCYFRENKHSVQDENAEYFKDKWRNFAPEDIAQEVLSDKKFWGHDLSKLPGFSQRVSQFVEDILQQGAASVLHDLVIKNEAKSLTDTPA